ncbi:MAG: peptidoglycan-binding protein, partial [Okeania sp. SIO2B9]|nr:peptidoglycan-binding protein [Okeania sp. SIO2B9]
MIINLIIIDSCWARRPEIPSPETNSYFNVSQTYQGQIATSSFFSGTSNFRPESNAILSPNSAVYLRRGDNAATVAAVQRKLRELGYFSANLTGYYGPITERAVRQFQQDNG